MNAKVNCDSIGLSGRRCLLGTLALAAATVASQSHGATATDSLGVSATVANSCTITASNAVAFGTYDPVVANAALVLDGAGAVSTTCTSGAAVVVTLGQGTNPGSGSTDIAPVRRMSATGGALLPYTLYQNTLRTIVWGNTAGTGYAETGIGAPHELPVYGKIPAAQNVPSGVYSDTVVATVTF